MRILITGATGFIGSSLADGLERRGHRVVRCTHARGSSSEDRIAVDFMRDTDPAAWLPRLHGIDAVINAVGILRETRSASFDNLHHRAPAALFQACEQAGMRHVIQVSALGADDSATSAYHRSKHAGDRSLQATALNWHIVQPSLVFGHGGASTGLFLQLASLPLVPLVGDGSHRLQPVHIDDLVALVTELLERPLSSREVIPAVGPVSVSLRELLTTYRRQLRLGPARCVPVPMPLMRVAAAAGDRIRAGALSSETLAMLVHGNTAPGERTAALLGHPARPVDAFMPAREAPGLRQLALWSWIRPLLLLTVALMWVSAGLVSWFAHQPEALALLQQLGVPAEQAPLLLAVSCGLNIGLGVATLLHPKRWLWWLQLAVVAFYTLMLTAVVPELWTDPFGPLVKNGPIAVLLAFLALVEK